MPEINRDFVSQEIATLRDKLIDLSKRNRLINFRHAERGATFVRVVDEIPDVLYSKSRDGKMGFDPLPQPDLPRQDENTESFQRAWETARLTDEQYLSEIQDLGDSPGGHIILDFDLPAQPPETAGPGLANAFQLGAHLSPADRGEADGHPLFCHRSASLLSPHGRLTFWSSIT